MISIILFNIYGSGRLSENYAMLLLKSECIHTLAIPLLLNPIISSVTPKGPTYYFRRLNPLKAWKYKWRISGKGI